MNKKNIVLCLLLFFLLFSGESVKAKEESVDITFLISDNSGLIFEATFSCFEIKERMSAQGIFKVIDIPDLGQTSEPGKPLLPIKGTLIEIPPTGDVTVKVLELLTEEYSNYYISPCPKYELIEDETGIHRQEKSVFDYSVYADSDFYPWSVAEVGFTGFIRDRRVAQIKIYPFQYNPATKVLRYNKRVMLQVLFEHPTPRDEYKRSDPYFEGVFRDIILNFKEKPFLNTVRILNTQEFNFLANSRPSDYKIPVNESGIYKTAYSDLTKAGISPDSIDARTLKIFCQGQEIAIYVSSQGSNFGQSDFIQFYGKAVNTEYADTNVYWLSWGGAFGKRITEIDGTPNSSPSVEYHYRKDHFEENKDYWIPMPNGDGKDHWFWERINAGESKNYSFNINKPASSPYAGKVKVTVFGRTSIGLYPDHHLKIHVNGIYLGEGYFDGQAEYKFIVDVDQSLLNQGNNTLEIELINDTGSPNSIYLNYFEIEYYDEFVASGNFLSFDITALGNKRIKITNFSQDSVEIFDITDHDNVKKIINVSKGSALDLNSSQMIQNSFNLHFGSNLRSSVFKRSQEAQGSFEAIFSGNFIGNEKILALTESAKKSSDIEVLSPSTISKNRKVDYIIITHEDFYNEAQYLAQYRRKGDFEVEVVKVGDIYDLFNHGIEDPHAIKDFLEFAYQNWEMPSYVLFLGDATVDPHDYMGTGRENFVPTYLANIGGALGYQAPSDNWFFCISGEDDVLPDFFGGRISVKSAEEARGVMHKIRIHETIFTSPRSGKKSFLRNKTNKNLARERHMSTAPSTLKRAMFVSDDDSPSFTLLNDELADNYFPSDFTKIKIYLENYADVNTATADIINNINQGVLIVNYVGHGSYDNWSGENLFLASDVDSLSNLRFPFVVTLSCLNGYFASWPRELWGRKMDDSLAEKFVNAQNKGAIACYAPSGLGYTWEHSLLSRNIYEMLFQPGDMILGHITTLAKIKAYTSGATSELAQTFMLFGDPACSLGLIEKE